MRDTGCHPPGTLHGGPLAGMATRAHPTGNCSFRFCCRMDRMSSRCRTSSLLIGLLLAASTSLVAQDRYASSVGVVDGDVLVMKARVRSGPGLGVRLSARCGRYVADGRPAQLRRRSVHR